MKSLPPSNPPARPAPEAMWQAFLARDPAAEGIFFVGVKTTRIFCRPTCGARKPRRENVVFFRSAMAAEHAGFRPCQRCQPHRVGHPAPRLVATLETALSAAPDGRIGDKVLAALGIDPATARRQFRRHHGMTFQGFARARRLARAVAALRDGADAAQAQLDGGFASASGFRAACARAFGAPPRKLHRSAVRWAARLPTPLGPMLALADDAGLHLLDFLDRKGLPRHLAAIAPRGSVAVVPDEHPVLERAQRQLAAYFAGERGDLDLPLAPLGSEWERAVWERLRTIPSGATASYGALATALGRPGAARAVGRANGANFRALVIPCHRVIRADGALCGYGGGLWRKRWLLEHERALRR
jgi:AraC family transcriptional regulator of adaptative response/methylated-DNA-[protein]-cysteine methyltransferase